MALIQDGKLTPGVDAKVFQGLEQIPLAIDYLYERKNIGKLHCGLKPRDDGAPGELSRVRVGQFSGHDPWREIEEQHVCKRRRVGGAY
ncbi:hypothetical protein ATCC90586_011497 [Pythium insidiosum]|nr:hypothetical protein ATCC90586_011497 [Pythium insidiosum]